LVIFKVPTELDWSVQFGHIFATQHLYILVLFNAKYICQGAKELCEIGNRYWFLSSLHVTHENQLKKLNNMSSSNTQANRELKSTSSQTQVKPAFFFVPKKNIDCRK